MEIIETSVGLPNNCFICGKPITTETWFAENIDRARSGAGAHKACLLKQAKPEPETEPTPELETYPTTAKRRSKSAS